jgi:Tol biopolymer transport system component
MLAKVHSCAVIGLEGVIVEVEVDTGQGLPYMVIVGLPDAAVQESRLIVEDEDLLFGANKAPAWLPDGCYLAYSVGLDEMTLLVVSATDDTLVWSSDLPGQKYDLSWSSNSAYLLFTNELDMLSQIYLLALADPDPVAMLPDPDNFLGMFAP